MTKAELIDSVAVGAKISKASASKAIDSFTGSITKTLKKGGKVTLVGFGTFSVSSEKGQNGPQSKNW